MNFTDIAPGETIFLDANTFIYHYLPDPSFGHACTALLGRAQASQVAAVSTTHLLSEVAHRLMTLEAEQMFSWPRASIGKKLRQHPHLFNQLNLYGRAIAEIIRSKVNILRIDPMWIQRATQLSDAYGLLSNDALIVAAMEAHGITAIASNDSDFDRVPTLRRYAPV